jgi:hypothetical protein
MRLCSYVVVYDTGFAPNPFWGYCTLAACTPNRQGVRLGGGDWLLGHSTLDQDQKLIYAMRVSEVLGFDEYYADNRFTQKHPRFDLTWREASGDNIYHRADDGTWLQDDNPFHGPDVLPQDTRNPRVYISNHFYYFGGKRRSHPGRVRRPHQGSTGQSLSVLTRADAGYCILVGDKLLAGDPRRAARQDRRDTSRVQSRPETRFLRRLCLTFRCSRHAAPHDCPVESCARAACG